MIPTYQSPCGRLVLYLADNLEVLPKLPPGSVDAIVSDPPYGTSGDGCAKVSGATKEGWTEFSHEWDVELPLEWIRCSAARAMKPGAAAIVWTDGKRVGEVWAAMDQGALAPLSLIYWNKTDPPTNPRKNFMSSVEAAVFARKPGVIHCWTGGGARASIIRCPKVHNGDRLHPTQKPVRVMEWCLTPITEPGHVVLDPFMGSGSTGVAALRMGRRFIGIEKDAGYFEAARKRLEAELNQGKLFDVNTEG